MNSKTWMWSVVPLPRSRHRGPCTARQHGSGAQEPRARTSSTAEAEDRRHHPLPCRPAQLPADLKNSRHTCSLRRAQGPMTPPTMKWTVRAVHVRSDHQRRCADVAVPEKLTAMPAGHPCREQGPHRHRRPLRLQRPPTAAKRWNERSVTVAARVWGASQLFISSVLRVSHQEVHIANLTS